MHQTQPRITQEADHGDLPEVESSPRVSGISLGALRVDSRNSKCVPFRLQNTTLNNGKSLYWYRGILGTVAVHKRCITRDSVRKVGSWIEVAPSFLNYRFELYFTQYLGRIPSTLTTYLVVPNKAPIFKLCSNGDIEGLRSAFSRNDMYPFVVDGKGKTLLHVCAPEFGITDQTD